MMIPVVYFSQTDGVLLLTIPILYSVTTALVLEYWQELLAGPTSKLELRRARKLGAIGGGVGAFTLGALSHTSFSVAVVGFGLLSFGIVITVAEYEGKIDDEVETWG